MNIDQEASIPRQKQHDLSRWLCLSMSLTCQGGESFLGRTATISRVLKPKPGDHLCYSSAFSGLGACRRFMTNPRFHAKPFPSAPKTRDFSSAPRQRALAIHSLPPDPLARVSKRPLSPTIPLIETPLIERCV
jgi:hypothetical protein